MVDGIIPMDAQFISFYDFFKNKDRIKRQYQKMNKIQQRIYKMYIYSTCFENEHTRDVMWEYLNCEFDYMSLDLYREYERRLRKKKNKKGR